MPNLFFRDAGNIRSRHSFISQSPNSRQSLVWVARILSGDPVRMGEGFDCEHNQTYANLGSGERWILFKLNIKLPGCSEPKVIAVHHGDIASELPLI